VSRATENRAVVGYCTLVSAGFFWLWMFLALTVQRQSYIWGTLPIFSTGRNPQNFVIWLIQAKTCSKRCPTSIWRPRRGWPRLNFAEIFGIRKLAIVRRYLRDPVFSNFCTVSACDGRADGRTNKRWQHTPR